MLDVQNLTAGYQNLAALKDISFRVGEGQIVAILGANGVGKSTLLKVISGLMRPWSGVVRFRGEEIQNRPAHEIVEAGIVLVPEGRHLFSQMTVLENLLVGNTGKQCRERRTELLESVLQVFPALGDRMRQLTSTLSGGEQQMVAVGRALMGQPRMLILDEPSLGLAPLLTLELFETFQTLNEGGLPILVVEQNVALALEICHYAYVMEDQSVAFSGDGETLRGDDRIREAYLGM